MPGKRLSLDTDDIVRRYQSGETPREIAAALGGSAESIRRRLRSRGELLSPGDATRRYFARPEAIAQARAAQAIGAAVHKRDDLDEAAVIADYLDGASALRLGKRYGASAPTIRRILDEHGVSVRDKSAAGMIRHYGPGVWENVVLLRSLARINKPMPEEVLRRAAVTKQRRQLFIGEGEDRLCEWLVARGLEVERQVAVDRYNLDLAVGNVAIEVHRTAHHPDGRAPIQRRVEYLVNAGWHTVYVWILPHHEVVEKAADELVVIVDEFRGKPAAPGEYRVIRSNGEPAVRWGGMTKPRGRPVGARDLRPRKPRAKRD